MRTILIILITIMLLGGGFYLALSWQDKPASVQKSDRMPQQQVVTQFSTSRPMDAPDANQRVGQGDRVWVQSFDKKTGELASEFYAEKYEPTTGDIVNVTLPQAKFYLGKTDAKQLLVIKGTDGKVLIPNATNRDKMKGGGGAPTRGELQHVTIELYEHVGDAAPQVVCTMPNASFDNDQFRIFTEAYQDEKGNAIPGDQVPVHVTGQYEFDGKGLEIKWNDRDRRLQSLEIAHGDHLVIRDIKALKLSGQGAQLLPLPDALADANPKALPEAVKKKKKKKPATQPLPGKNTVQRDRSTPVYRATFSDDVKIFEADAQIGTANQLLVDFLMNLSQKPTTAPSTQPAHSRATRQEDVELVALDVPSDKTAVKGPITVRWTGKLVVQPLDDPGDAPEPGETNIGLIGSPVHLDRNGSQITGAIVTYRTGDSGFSAESDEQTPLVTLKDAHGATITTKSIDYNGVGEPAVLEGKSHAEIPVQGDDPTKPPQLVKADWDESCLLQLSGDAVDKLQIQQADLKGNVTLNHPQMHGRSDALSISFEPETAPTTSPTTQPTMTIKQLLASGAVDYTVTDDKQQSQSIQSEKLTVVTAKGTDGKLYASAMNAEGNVHTRDPEREMFAGRLAVKLAPTAKASSQPAQNIDVESLQADENVRIVTVKGQTATAGHLTLASSNGTRQIELIGSPNAAVSDAQSSLSGPVIRFDPDLGNASVVGAGSLSAIQKAAPDAKPRHITASWEGDLQLQGKENIATINGPVMITTPSEDGSVNTATGRTLLITMADAPTTQPTTKSVAGIGDVSGFSNKVIQTYTLKDNVEVKSILSDASGALLRRVHVFSDKLNYDQEAKRLTIPGAGRMLVQDDRQQAPTTQPTLLGDGGMRGATAFEWQKQLSYDENASRVDLTGGVRVVHKGEGDSPFEVSAEQMTADLIQTPTGEKQEKVDLKKLTAKGGVQFTSAQLQFGSDEVEYDPITHRLIATASPGRFSELFDQSGVSRGSFSQLIFNTETNQIESMKDFRATVAR